MNLKNWHFNYGEHKISNLLDNINKPINIAKLSSKQIKEFSDEDLVAILTGEKNIGGMLPLPLQSILTNELLTRSIKASSTPHWTTKAGFWVTVIAAFAACIAAYPVIFQPQEQQPVVEVSKTDKSMIFSHNKGANSQQLLLHSPPTQVSKPEK